MGTLTKVHLPVTGRDYFLYAPDSVPQTAPVLLYYHGGGQGDPQKAFLQTGLNAVADREKFVLVMPLGSPAIPNTEDGRTFNAGVCCGWALQNNVNEVAALNELHDNLKSKGFTIPKMYGVGISNGSIVLQNLAISDPNPKFTAICSVAGGMGINPQMAQNTKQIPVLMFHGGLDTHYPYLGGSGPDTAPGISFYSIPDTVNYWSQNNRATKSSSTIVKNSNNVIVGTKNTYKGRFFSFGVKPVELIFFPNGGHTWPGGTDLSGKNGPVVDFDANSYMWNFFIKGGNV